MKRLFLMLLATVSLIACEKGGDDTPKPIELTGNTETSQTIYADETSKAEGIKFKATADWTATVSEATTKADDKMWFRLSAYEGKAGDITLGFEIDANDTGKDRKAEIRITCGGITITVVVEQKATNKPEDPDKPEPVFIFITADGKISGSEILGDELPVELRGMIASMEDLEVNEVSPEAVAYTPGKHWILTLPTPDSKTLGRFHSTAASTGPTITPVDTKFAGGNVVGDVTKRLELTNISLENLKKDEDYRKKKGEGFVKFVYAAQDVVINGVLKYSGDPQTFNFNNCQLRKGWNELMMVAATDAAADGKVTINVTANNATSDFRWVARVYASPNPDPQPGMRYVKKLISKSYSYESEMAFEYDDQMRITKIVNEISEIYGVPKNYTDNIYFHYKDNTISLKSSKAENGVEQAAEDMADITLNPNGTVKQSIVIGTEESVGPGTGTMMFSHITRSAASKTTKFKLVRDYTYDAQGYVTKVTEKEEKNGVTTENGDLYVSWSDSNLAKVETNRDGNQAYDEFKYSDIENKPCNWDMGIQSGTVSNNVFDVVGQLGLTGKRSKNLPSSLNNNLLYYSYREYIYTLDPGGYVVSITEKERLGDISSTITIEYAQ